MIRCQACHLGDTEFESNIDLYQATYSNASTDRTNTCVGVSGGSPTPVHGPVGSSQGCPVKGDPPNTGLGQQDGTDSCPEFLMSIQQLGSNFGCILLTSMVTYQGASKVWHSIPGVLEAHKLI